MIKTKDCGCEIQIKGTNGLSTVAYVQMIKQCEKHRTESLDSFWKDILKTRIRNNSKD